MYVQQPEHQMWAWQQEMRVQLLMFQNKLFSLAFCISWILSELCATLGLMLRILQGQAAGGEGWEERQVERNAEHTEGTWILEAERAWVRQTVAFWMKLGIFSFSWSSRVRFSSHKLSGRIWKPRNINLVNQGISLSGGKLLWSSLFNARVQMTCEWWQLRQC